MVIGKLNTPPPINPRPGQGPQPAPRTGPQGPQPTAQTQSPQPTQQTAPQTPVRKSQPLRGRPGALRPGATSSARLNQQQQMTSPGQEQRLTGMIASKGVVQTGPQPQLQVLKKHEGQLKTHPEADESRELEQEEQTSETSKAKEKDKPKESEKTSEPQQQEAPKQQEKLQDVPTPQPREPQERDSEGGRGRQQQRRNQSDESESPESQSGESSDAIPEAPPLPGPSQSRYADQNPNRLASRPLPRPSDPPPQKTLSEVEASREQVTRQQLSELGQTRVSDGQTLKRTVEPTRQVALAKEVNTGELLTDSLGAPHWQALVGNHAGKLEQQLRSSLLPGKRTELYAQAVNAGQAIFASSQSQPAVRLQMALCGREQLREIFAREIGNLRPDKYQNPSYEALSERKRELVDKLVSGFESARDTALSQPAQVSALKTHGTQVGTQALARVLGNLRPGSDEVFSLTLKSKNDLMADLAVATGAISAESLAASNREDSLNVHRGTPTWQQKLSPQQRDLLTHLAGSMSQTLDQQIPNRPAATTVSFNTPKGPQDVPSAITLNGVTYSQPRHLGTGGMGLILEYTDQTSGQSVVVKSVLDLSKRAEMSQELTSHRHAMGGENGQGHPNLVGLRGVVRGHNDVLYMVMDKAGGGDLDGVSVSIDQAARSGLPPRARVALVQAFMHDALQGMQHLQERNMMHLDVKPLNFLLADDGRVMVSDLGSAQRTTRVEDHDLDIPTTYGSPEWAREKTLKTDVYQLGLSLRTMLTGTQEREPIDGQQGAMHELLNAMVDPDPAKRPTIEAILQHSFMRDAKSQDPEKMTALKTAAVDYAQAVGRPLTQLRSEINNVQNSISVLEKAVRLADPVKAPDTYALKSKELSDKQQELAQLQTRVQQIHQQPQNQPLHQALLQAASGLV